MTTTNITSSNLVFRGFAKKPKQLYKILPNAEHKLYITLDIRDRGGRRRGRFHQIREYYINKDQKIYAGFKSTDETGYFYEYAVVGKLMILSEDSKGVSATA